MTAAAPLVRALPPVYAAAALRLAVPLLLLPLMASRLGPDEFGRLSLLLVWAGIVSVLVEGGFLAAATRAAVAAARPERLLLAQRVFSARCVLSAAAVLLALPAAAWGQEAAALNGVAMAALACALGWPATWYLQATQQLHRWARVEIVVHAVWLLAAWALAYSVAAYLWLNVAASGALALAGWWWLKRDLQAPALWSAAQVRPGLALGWTMMPVAFAGAAYSMALPAVASAQMARAELGIYYLADRAVRALLAAAEPLYALVYPRIVARFGAAFAAGTAWRYASRWAAAGALAGLLLLAAGAAAWPLAGPRWVGAAAPSVAPVIAVLALLLPLLLGWKFIGYAMLGSGRHDRAYRACVGAGAVFGVAAAAAFASRGAVTLAWVAVATELVVIATALLGMALGTARR